MGQEVWPGVAVFGDGEGGDGIGAIIGEAITQRSKSTWQKACASKPCKE